MKITKYPQSCILIENYKGKNILIDPGSYVYDMTDVKPEDWKNIDILLLTHEHLDHTLPEAIKVIVQNNSPVILTNKPVHEILGKQGIKSEILGPGQEKVIDTIKIKAINSEHGSLAQFGKPTPENVCFLIDNKFFHMGDTAKIQENPDAEIIFIPICGTVVMDAKEAAGFVKETKPKLAIPIHYSNPKFPITTDEFEKQMASSDIQIKILKDKESIEL